MGWSKFSRGGHLYQYRETFPSLSNRFDTTVSDLFILGIWTFSFLRIAIKPSADIMIGFDHYIERAGFLSSTSKFQS